MARKRHVESSPTEQLSASLKALPADAPPPGVSLGVEGSSVGPASAGQAHWTVNDPRRVPSKKVSLKLSKVGSGGQSASRSASSPFQQPPARAASADLALGGSASLKKGRRFAPDAATADLLQTAQLERSPAGKTPSLCSTAPPALNRPPRPPAVGGSVKAEPQRPTSSGGQQPQSPGAQSKYEEDHEGIIVDEGRIFAPRVAAPLNVLPPSSRRSSACSVASGSESVVQPRSRFAQVMSRIQQEQDVAEVPAFPRIAWGDAPTNVAYPAIPESEMLEMETQIHRDFLASQLEQEEAQQEEEEPSESASAQAVPSAAGQEPGQRRRNNLQKKESQASLNELEEKLGEASKRAEASRRELTSYLTGLREKRFEEPPSFEPKRATTEEEPLVSLPEDFEDICDLTMQMSAFQRRTRRSSVEAPSAASRGGAEEGSSFQLPDFLQKYFFEEKAKEEFPHLQLQAVATTALADLPEPDQQRKPSANRDAVAKGLEQIARLDTLLLKREAMAQAKRTAAEVDLQATKTRLQREAESALQQTEMKLQKLKAKGLVKQPKAGHSSSKSGGGSVPSSSRSSVSSVQLSVSVPGSSQQHQVVGSSKAAVPSPHAAELGTAPKLAVDWSQWTSSAADDAASMPSFPQADEPASNPQPQDAAEPDTMTFHLTSMTTPGPQYFQQQATWKPAHNNVAGHNAGGAAATSASLRATLAVVEEKDEMQEESHVLQEGEDLLQEAADDVVLPELHFGLEPADSSALAEIDKKLRELVPEQEWESKSISSYPQIEAPAPSMCSGSNLQGGGQSIAADGRFSIEDTHHRIEDIDSRLRALQASQRSLENLPQDQRSSATPPLATADLQRLLFDAVRSSEPMSAKDKVLSLTQPLADATAADAAVVPSHALPMPVDNPKLRKASEMLQELVDSESLCREALGDMDSATAELEVDVQHFEQSLLSAAQERPAEMKDAAENQQRVAEAAGPETVPQDFSRVSERLEQLRGEVALLIEREEPARELLLRLRTQEQEEQQREAELESAGNSELLAFSDDEVLGSTAMLATSAHVADEAYLSDEDLDEPGDIASSLAAPAPGGEPLVSGSVPFSDMPSALDLEIPQGDELWDDEVLERMAQKVNEHFGDADKRP